MSKRGKPTEARKRSVGAAGALLRGLPLRDLLRLSTLRGARVLGGRSGLDRVIKRLNVMTLPEILPWVKENELLLTTGYPLPRSPGELATLVSELDNRQLAALAIKLGPYLKRVPAEMLARADDLGFPVLEIPHEVAFDDILSQVLVDIANRETANLIRSEEIHRCFMQIVLDGGGLPEITEELAKLIGGSVAVVDADDQIVAESGLANGSGSLTSVGIVGPSGRLSLGQPLTSGLFRVGPRVLATVPIAAGAFHFGRLVAVEGEHSLPDDTLLALERASTVAALAVTRELAVTAVERKYRADFLHDVLMRRQEKPEDVEIRARMFGWDLGRPLAVIVAMGEAGATRRGWPGEGRQGDRLRSCISEAWTSAVRAHDEHAAAGALSSELVAIVGASYGEGKEMDLPKLVASVAARMSGAVNYTLSYGASRPASQVSDLPEAYRQASCAVKIGRQVHGPGAVTTFDSLGLFRLLSRIGDEDELRSFVHEALGPVLQIRSEYRDEMIQTLTVLIDSNLNATATAQVLHLHYNSVRYRIAKLERMLGPFTSDRHVCQQIEVALQIRQLRDLA